MNEKIYYGVSGKSWYNQSLTYWIEESYGKTIIHIHIVSTALLVGVPSQCCNTVREHWRKTKTETEL